MEKENSEMYPLRLDGIIYLHGMQPENPISSTLDALNSTCLVENIDLITPELNFENIPKCLADLESICSSMGKNITLIAHGAGAFLAELLNRRHNFNQVLINPVFAPSRHLATCANDYPGTNVEHLLPWLVDNCWQFQPYEKLIRKPAPAFRCLWLDEQFLLQNRESLRDYCNSASELFTYPGDSHLLERKMRQHIQMLARLRWVKQSTCLSCLG